ncbi:MAG: hypothetical protein ABIH47_07060 [Candidatus Omnitrophota bacterium]
MFVIFRNSDEIRRYDIDNECKVEILSPQGALTSNYNAKIILDKDNVYISDCFNKRIIKINKLNFAKKCIDTSDMGGAWLGGIYEDKFLIRFFDFFPIKNKGLYLMAFSKKDKHYEKIECQFNEPYNFSDIFWLGDEYFSNDIASNRLFTIDVKNKKMDEYLKNLNRNCTYFTRAKGYDYILTTTGDSRWLEKYTRSGDLVFKHGFMSHTLILKVAAHNECLWLLDRSSNALMQYQI